MRAAVVIALILILASSGFAFTEYTLIKADPEAKVIYTNPVWSPDGRSIAYVSTPCDTEGQLLYSKGNTIHLATLSNDKWTHKPLVREAENPVWSPNGRLLAFDRKGVAIRDMMTGRITQITKSRLPSVDGRDEAEAYYDSPISLSPNGRYIVYHRQLWEDSEMRIYDLQKNRDLGFNIGQLFAWSPDSKYIMAASSWYMDEQVPTRIIKWNLSTLKYRTILRNYRVNDIIWPKGLGFILVSLENPLEEGPETDLRPPRNPGVYKLNPANGALASVSKITDWIMPCPNYRRFAFLSRQADNTEASALCVGELKTWQFSLIAKDAANQWNWHEKFELMSWSPDGKSLAYVTEQGDIRIVKFAGR